MSIFHCPKPKKRWYDTEFEATRAAAIAEFDLRSQMNAYRCGNHWHITNRIRKYRTGLGSKRNKPLRYLKT